MQRSVRVLLLLAFTALALRSADREPHGDPPYLLESGWTPLLRGGNLLDGWQYEHEEKGRWAAAESVYWDGAGLPKELKLLHELNVAATRIANGPRGGSSNIFTRETFGDMELYLEFLIAAQSNSGAYLHGLYEVQIYDSFGVAHPKYLDCGGIYQRWIDGRGEGGTPPLENASRRAGEWQSLHIWFRGPKFDGSGKKTADAVFERVLLNGRVVQQNTAAPGPTRSGLEFPEAARNPLMLQGDHGPVAYRNVYWRPLR